MASRSDSGLGRTNGGGLARAVSAYGCLRDLRESEVPGRASDGTITATDVVFEREHQSVSEIFVALSPPANFPKKLKVEDNYLGEKVE